MYSMLRDFPIRNIPRPIRNRTQSPPALIFVLNVACMSVYSEGGTERFFPIQDTLNRNTFKQRFPHKPNEHICIFDAFESQFDTRNAFQITNFVQQVKDKRFSSTERLVYLEHPGKQNIFKNFAQPLLSENLLKDLASLLHSLYFLSVTAHLETSVTIFLGIFCLPKCVEFRTVH